LNYLKACFIRVEVKKRELISRIDLAIEMVKRGVPVILGECYDSNDLLSLGIERGYFFGKCAQPSTLLKFKPLLDSGWSFGALDEEGLLPNSLEKFASERFSYKCADIYKDIFFFGEEQKEAFVKIFGDRDSFIVSGNPRSDMWQTKCYGIYDKITLDIKKKYGNFVLVPLNFDPYTTFAIQSSSEKKEYQSSNKSLSERSEFLFDNFCKFAEKLATEANIDVVIRPHPSDDPQTITALMVKHGVKSSLVKCISEKDIFPWISATKILFHNCCATSLEAGFYGTPVVTYAPSNMSLHEQSEINNLFPIVNKFEDALSFLKDTDKINPLDFKDRLAKWRRLSLKNSGSIASSIADKITLRNKFESYEGKKFHKNTKFDFKRIKYELISKASSLIGLRQRKVYLEKFPRTSIDEIKNIVDHISSYRGYKEQLDVHNINSRLFGLFPKTF
jgi:surface carbohydrate biosynthesis protein